MTIHLSTGLWALHTTPVSGLTCYGQTIYIDPNFDTERDLIDTVIHEALHASRKDLSERAVSRLAGDVSTVMWSLGYRRKKPARKSRA